MRVIAIIGSTSSLAVMGKAAKSTRIGRVTNTPFKTNLELQILSRYQPTPSTKPSRANTYPNKAHICSHLAIKRSQNKTAIKSNWLISSGTNQRRDRKNKQEGGGGEKTCDEWTTTKGASIARAGTRGYFFDRCIRDQRLPLNSKSFIGTKTRTTT